MEENVTFASAGLKLAGIVHTPEGAAPAPRPALIALHGFGSNKSSAAMQAMARLFAERGYVAMRFDFRGCGESEGEPARVICLEQVEDVRNAVSYLAARNGIDQNRIGVIGHSFGAAVAVYAAGVDARIACCISSGGWGDGVKKFRKQHESPEAWARFQQILTDGPKYRVEHGRSMPVPRFDIVPIPVHLRGNLAPGSHLSFPFEVVESMLNFRANDVVGKIAPRPLLLLHPAMDTVTPTEQSIDLFAHAGQPTDLYLVSECDHFLLQEGNQQVIDLVDHWLAKHFPVGP